MLRGSIAVLVLSMLLVSWVYQILYPPSPKICGSTPNGPPITGPRIKLRDGRHLAYKEFGLPKQVAKFKLVFIHGFFSCRHDPVITFHPEVYQQLGVHIVSFDRPGYGESDPDPNRSPRSLAMDVEELADQLGLGDRFYVVGFSMGEAYYLQLPQDQWTLRVAHYAPWTYWWNTQKWFPASGVAAGHPEVFSTQDLEILSKEELPDEVNKAYIIQQGEYEALHRDMMVGFGSWEFDPMEIENQFSNNEGSVQVWQGDEDRMVPVMLQRYIGEKLPWVKYHELAGVGHMFPLIPNVTQAILTALLSPASLASSEKI
ncbi:hypothetical protein LINPERHAP1_LOCUS3182 [Linum perenne]